MATTIRLILIILLLAFFECKPKTESLPKEIAEKYLISFVQNPNGIAYYKDPTDLKSKLGVIPYKAMFGREESHEMFGKTPAIKIWYEGKVGFIFYSKMSFELYADVISFTEENSVGGSSFGVVESDAANLYNSPFADEQLFDKVGQFTLVQNIESSIKNKENWIRLLYKEKKVYSKAKIAIELLVN